MGMPKFKKTNWKVGECISCGGFISEKHAQNHKQHPYYKEHTVLIRDNVPMLIPDMKFDKFTYKNYIQLKSEAMNRKFLITPNEFEDVLKSKVGFGGVIPNQWWVWVKKGTLLSLRWLPEEENNE